MKRRRIVLGLTLFLLLAAANVFAEEEPTLDTGDTAWMIVATALVMFMTPVGLALFYGGMSRSKNLLNTFGLSFTSYVIGSVLWMICGYTLAFGPDIGGVVGGSAHFFLNGIGVNDLSGTIPAYLFIVFQMTFAGITVALISGSIVERMKFSSWLVFATLWLIFVYSPVCHWVWGGGWLYEMGLLDFAGGTVVHVNAGVAALVAALVMGRRKGFPHTAMPPHNLTMTVAGAAMLWVAGFGFNAGSALAANGDAGMAMLVTHIGAASGALAWMFMEWTRHGKPSVLGLVTGMVAGLGTITPASGYVGPVGALIIGLTAGVVCYFSTAYIKRVLHIDDSLDVFPVHGVGGVIGTLMAGVFVSMLGGVGLAEGMTSGHQIAVQFAGVAATFAWCAIASWIILKVIDATIGLRVSPDQETEGLDTVLHDETGYNL